MKRELLLGLPRVGVPDDGGLRTAHKHRRSAPAPHQVPPETPRGRGSAARRPSRRPSRNVNRAGHSGPSRGILVPRAPSRGENALQLLSGPRFSSPQAAPSATVPTT